MQTVLLVEDNRVTRIAMQRLIAKAGFDVVIAQDGEEAIRVAEAALPDVVLLDMLLPKLDGVNVLTHLKRNPATAHIPVIVLTGLSSRNAPKLREAGAAGFIEKGQMLDDSSMLLSLLNQSLPTANVLHLSLETRVKTAAAI